jgi:sterol desaturase/sphingolipid hydroxylase (fatty acid hydroxylase superfamily)
MAEDPERAAEFRRNGLSLKDAARLFMTYKNARILVPAAGAAIAARVVLGRFSRRDAAVVAVTVGIEPFVEWLVHVHVLHQPPRTVGGRRVELLSSRSHRAHHMEPRDPRMVFVYASHLVPIMAGLAASNALLIRKPRAIVTGVATSFTFLAAYEWTHFLIHSSYVPRTALYRTIRRTHQLHHFRNENYWFGIMTPVSDKVLNTYPAKDRVPASPTVKTLGIKAGDAEDFGVAFRGDETR